MEEERNVVDALESAKGGRSNTTTRGDACCVSFFSCFSLLRIGERQMGRWVFGYRRIEGEQ